MTILETKLPNAVQKEFIYNVWNKEYPKNLGFKTLDDLDNYLFILADVSYYFLYNDANEMEGWAMKFIRDEEKWFAIIVDSDAHGHGKGTSLLSKLKENEAILNGWVVDHQNDTRQNGAVYKSPLSFYLKNQFKIDPGSRLENPVLSAAKITWRRTT